MALNMSPNLGLAASRSNSPIPIDDPVIADVAPTALLDMPAADLGDFFGEGVPIQSGWVSAQCRMISVTGYWAVPW